MVNRLVGWLACVCVAFFATAAAAQKLIDLQGHRGARGLWPENTLAGFGETLKLGVTTLELDVVVTKDGVLVISHDPALNPAITRSADGRFIPSRGPNIIDLTFEQLQAYDVGKVDASSSYGRNYPEQKPVDGQRIPKLKDLFELVKASGDTKVKLAIEAKITPLRPEQTPSPEKFADMLLEEIRDNGFIDRVQILSFDWRVLQHVQRLSPGVPTVYLTVQARELDNLMVNSNQDSPWTAGFQFKQHGSVPRMIKAAGGTHWSSFWRELDAQKVREAQALGLKVLAWTVNDRAVMASMLDLGVDGLVTDRPDLAIELLKERKLRWLEGQM